MTAYVRNASGDYDESTKWTPNGVPGSVDTATIGVFSVAVPTGKTWSVGALTITGTATGSRSILDVSGTLQLNADMTITNWSDIRFQAGSVLDCLGNFGIRCTAASSTNAPNKFTITGTEANPVLFTRSDYVSGEPSSMISTGTLTAAASAFFDATYLVVNKMASLRVGGGNNAGNHYRLNNVVFDSAGFIQTAANSNLADDWIWDKVDIRHTHIADISSGFFMELQAGRNTSGTPTGTKRFRNVTAKTDNERTTKYIRFISADYFTNVSFVSDSVSFQIGSSNTNITYKNIAARCTTNDYGLCTFGGVATGTVFEDNIMMIDATDYVVTGSFHCFESQKLVTFKNNYCEEIFLQTGFDGSDWYAVPQSGTVNMTGNIFVLQNGGVICNTWKGDVSADLTIDHNTYISRTSNFGSSNRYGSLMRTESGPRCIAGTNTIKNNLCTVFDTSGSSDGNIPIAYLEKNAPLIDQLDVIRNNNSWNMGTNLTNLYSFVTSSTKTLGDIDYGGSDLFLDPQFTNFPMTHKSPIRALAQSIGGSQSKDLWDEMRKINGFNETTRRQETASKTTMTPAVAIAALREYCRPFNSLLATAAYDGFTIGAVQYVAPPVVSGNFGRALTGSALSGRALTGVALTGT